MIVDTVPFLESLSQKTSELHKKSIRAFVTFIERRLGALILRSPEFLSPYGPKTYDPLIVAQDLIQAGILAELPRMTTTFCDEPPIRMWHTVTAGKHNHLTGGISAYDDAAALYAAIAEGLERYLWAETSDYFLVPMVATEAEIAKRGPRVALNRFAGLSAEQREHTTELAILPGSQFLWIKGDSLVSGKKTFLPAQIVSAQDANRSHDGVREPLVRIGITTGLATWTDRTGARLRGALECIERDAYMIWWLNQLIVPRMSIQALCARDSELADLVATCARYRIQVHVLRLVTDAPTHAVCVVLEDTSPVGPRFTYGLKASRQLPYAVKSGILEALRARNTFRQYRAQGNSWNPDTKIAEIGHRDRLYYWSVPEHASHLASLITGPEVEPEASIWDADTEAGHLDRIVAWCRDVGYELLSVPLGTSRSNPTSWHVEMTVIPELQPTYVHEKLRQASGLRLASVPKLFGYSPRKSPYTAAPHPFI